MSTIYRLLMQGLPATTARTVNTPDGERGTRAALAVMARYAREGKTDWRVRALAMDLVKDLPPKDYLAEATIIHRFVRDKIRYVRDINDVETVATPIETLKSGQGDCDDKSTLIAALLESIGFVTRFCAVAKFPGQWSHVLTQCDINGKWLSLECTEPVSPGWHPVGYPYQLIQYVDKKGL